MGSMHIARKAVDRITTKVGALPQWVIDQSRSTYSDGSKVPRGELRFFLTQPFLAAELDRLKTTRLADLYMQHQFDIYGSGWKNSRTFIAVEVPKHCVERSQALRGALPADYLPLDWHGDLKTGYHWSPRTWFYRIRKKGVPGDVRRAWELGRCHHWHILAQAYALTGDASFAREICNQFYDFVSANPPRFGVHWTSAMDVAIRASNWLVAVDCLQAHGAILLPSFVADFTQSLWEHGQHIVAHMESKKSDRGNHYLANICGLIFIASYLPQNSVCQKWLEFAKRELNREVQRQFLADGGLFECSTSYHRLSTEMALYAIALLLASGGAVEQETIATLYKATRFTQGILKASGEAPQIGDNDGGRFLKLDPAFDGLDGGEPVERPLDHRHLVQASSAFFSGQSSGTEAAILRQILGRQTVSVQVQVLPQGLLQPKMVEDFDREYQQAPSTNRCQYVVAFGTSVDLGSLRTLMWPDFGLYVIKSEKFYLSIRCDHRRHACMEGHAHNDVFAVDLQADGVDLLRDPGSYVYDPNPALRNQFRSVANHFPSQLLNGLAHERFSSLLFTFHNRLAGECAHFDSTRFVGACRNVRVSFQVEKDKLFIQALSDRPIPPADRLVPSIQYCPGYGRLSEVPAYSVASVALHGKEQPL